jgi:hypothetical protein
LKVSVNGILGEVITGLESNLNYLLVNETKLHQNYPNPFNSSTIIKYEIQKEENVKLNIYNILGEKIKNIIDEYKSEGSYTLTITLDGFPSGTYIYTFQAGSKLLVKKLILLK